MAVRQVAFIPQYNRLDFIARNYAIGGFNARNKCFSNKTTYID